VAEDAELAVAEPVAQAARLLRELIGQDFELDEDDVPRLRRGTAKDRILSVHDPEMRHGRKSQRQRFDGYKIHATAATETPLLTAIEVSPGCDYDGELASALVDQQPPQLKPTRLLGDAAYSDSETREQMEAREVDVLAVVPEPPPPLSGRFGKRDFHIDLDAGTVTCPAGEVARIGPPQRSGMRAAIFPAARCRACALKSRCVAGRRGRKIDLRRREDLLQAGRETLKDPPTREHLRRTRPLIERLLGLLVHHYQARKSRYRGKRKACFQAAWTAVLVNLHPIEAALTATPA
jgi:hypothetical protein